MLLKMWYGLKFTQKNRKASATKELFIKAPRQPGAEELILQLMILHPAVIPQIKQAQIADDLREPKLKRLMLFILEHFDNNHLTEPGDLVTHLEEEDLKNLITELVIKEERIIDIPKTLNNCIQKLKDTSIKNELLLLNTKIKEAEQEKDENAMKRFLVHKQELLEKRKRYTSDQFTKHPQQTPWEGCYLIEWSFDNSLW